MEKRKNLNRINNFLDIPKEIISNETKLTILGFREILIENYKNILEYEENFIKINTYTGCVSFWGGNLRLKQMAKEDIIIEGAIEKIDYESNTDNY